MTENHQCLWCGGVGYLLPNGFHPSCLEEFLKQITNKNKLFPYLFHKHA